MSPNNAKRRSESAQPPSVHSTPSANGPHPRPENIESPASLSGHIYPINPVKHYAKFKVYGNVSLAVKILLHTPSFLRKFLEKKYFGAFWCFNIILS